VPVGPIPISGEIRPYAREGAILEVDGASIGIDADGRFATERPFDADGPFQSFDVVLDRPESELPLARRRLTTIAGEGLDAGARVAGGTALRLSDLALDALATEMAAQVEASLDVEALLRSANPVAEASTCITPTPFGCAAHLNVDANIEQLRFDRLKVLADSRQGFLRIDVILKRLEIDYDTDGDVDCRGRIRTEKVEVPGDYLVGPDAAKPWRLDVNLVPGSMRVVLQNFDHDFTDGVCDVPVIDEVIENLMGDIDDLVKDAFLAALDDPDGDGPKDSPVAKGIESAIDFGTLWTPVADAFEVGLDSNVGSADADRQGLAIGFDPLVLEPATGCGSGPTLRAALRVPGAAVAWGDLTPSGQPYDVAVALSASTLNQMLRTRTTCGWLRTTLDSLDLGGGPLPLTAGLLSFLIPELAALPAGTPLTISLEPRLAPVVTGEAGPSGEPLDLRVGHWIARLSQTSGTVLLEMAIGLHAGLDLAFAPDGTSLEMSLASVPDADVRGAVIGGALEVDEARAVQAVTALVPSLVSSLGLDFEPIPLPPLAGLSLAGVEVSRVGDAVVAFLALPPPPPAAP